MIDGYDAWKLASPDEQSGTDRCEDCRGELGVHEVHEGICAQCVQLRIDELSR